MNRGGVYGAPNTSSGGGILRSQYTNSDAGESEFDTHSQFQQQQQQPNRRRQWGNPTGGETTYGNTGGGGRDSTGIAGSTGLDDHFKSNATSGVNPIKLGGLNDLAGITEIEALDLGAGSRRGSFSKPMGAGNRTAGSESKERPRDHSSGIGGIGGIPRPQTGGTFDNKRPQTTGEIGGGGLRGYGAFGSS